MNRTLSEETDGAKTVSAAENPADRHLRLGLYRITAMALYLPPFIGGTLMGIAGYYPMPEFYAIFVSYTGPYVLGVSILCFALTRREVRYFLGLSRLTPQARAAEVARKTRQLFWQMLLAIVLYSIGGALSANFSVVQLGLRPPFTFAEHARTMIGIIPAVLIAAFPIFFYLTDHLGRHFAPSGVKEMAAPLSAKFFVLGLFTPILIDSLLIGYLSNRIGSFPAELVYLWLGLMLIAAALTWLAWKSVTHGLQPLRNYLGDSGAGASGMRMLVPQSLDELGVLTGQLQSRIEAEGRLRTIIDSAPDLIASADPEGRLLYMNSGGRRMLGLEEGFDVTTTRIPDYHDPATAARILHEVLPVCIEKGYWEGENPFRCRDGTTFIGWQVIMAHRGPRGELSSISTITRDLTERKDAEARIESALREKEVLLKEIYHRVKNNLQVVSSLLNMQGRGVTDPAMKQMLDDSSNRVKSMALVHEQLYRSNDLSKIRFGDYVKQLVSHLMYAHRALSQTASVRTDVGEIDLGVETAVPCGLILNELISNAYKHGHGEGAQGEILLRVERAGDGRLRLLVRDGGRGLPPAFDARASDTLGLRLVVALVDQLEGELRWGSEGGAWFEVLFMPGVREAERLVH